MPDSGPIPGCLIVSGIPGAGKTTICRLLAGELERSAHVQGDDVSQMIVSGGVGPVSEPRDEADRQLLLRAHNICSLANNFSRFGFYPILDHVVPDRRILDLMVSLLKPRPVLFVTLAPALALAQRRNRSRTEADRVDYSFAELREQMSTELTAAGWWFDTSDLTAADTADAIRREARTRSVVAV